MPFQSKAIIRKMIGDGQGGQREIRIFERPEGGYTRANYPNDMTPDDDPIGEVERIGLDDLPEFYIKAATGKDLDDI